LTDMLWSAVQVGWLSVLELGPEPSRDRAVPVVFLRKTVRSLLLRKSVAKITG